MKRKLLSISILYIATMLAGIGVNAQITTWDELYNAFQNGGGVTLSQDITYSGSKGALVVPSGKTVTLDLNGYTINRNLSSAVKYGSVIQVKGKLIINDIRSGGQIRGGYVERIKDDYDGGGGLYIFKNGEVTMNGGSICYNKASHKGPGVFVAPGGKMTMNGGYISYNQNMDDNSGGGVYIQAKSSYSGTAEFTMNDGEISHNIAGHGAGVYVDGETAEDMAVLYFHGGRLCYNQGNDGGNGGGVCVRNFGYFYMDGGYIYDNHVDGVGGGIYIENGSHSTMTILDNPIMGIYENTAEVEGDDIESDYGANLNLISPEQMTRADGSIYFGGKSKWITDVEGKRFRDGKGSVASKQSGKITTGASLAISIPCPWCDLQDQIDNAPNNVSTTITLAGDITANLSEHFHFGTHKDCDTRLLVPANKIIVLDLNGNTLDRNLKGKDAMVDGNVFTVTEGASLTIKDSSKEADNPYGKGIITGGNHSSEGGAIYNDGTFVLENGNITGNRTTDIGGALFNAGELLMKNGSVSGNSTDGCGGGICNEGILTVTGGIITGNKALGTEFGGGGIYNDDGCTVTISNCKISSNQGDLGGAIQNMGMGTVTMTNSEITDNIARLNGNGIFQKGVMNLGSGNTFGKDQIVYLPAGADADHKSQYVITKVGNFTGTVPIKLENEVVGRDILVSKTGAASSTEGKVVDSDLIELFLTLSNNKYIQIYNQAGRDGDVNPKDVIELSIGVLVTKSGLKAGESAAFSVYEKGKPSKAVNIILTGVDNEGTAVSQTISIAFNATEITVKELPWSWAYNASGSTEITQDISSSNGNVFTFTNEEKENAPLRDEAIKNNAIINAREGVTVNEWEKEKRKIEL